VKSPFFKAVLAFAFLTLAGANALGQETVKYVQWPMVTGGSDIWDDGPYVLGDDFVCTNTGPITDIHLWGSWLTNQVDSNSLIFTLAIYSNVPPMPPSTNSHPGQLLWQEQFAPGQYVESLYATGGEAFLDPGAPGSGPATYRGPDSEAWYYSFYPTNVFVQQGTPAAPQTYWLMAYAQDTNMPSNLFGWKTTSSVSNDISVHAMWSGSMTTNYTNSSPSPTGWGVTEDPYFVGVDLAFKITTGPPSPCPESNGFPYVQWPKIIGGYDVSFSTTSTNLLSITNYYALADDFVPLGPGGITDIHLWGSWLNDVADPGSLVFWLAIYDNGSAGGVYTNSYPNNLLWQEEFVPGQYSESEYGVGQENFLDPGQGTNSCIICPSGLIYNPTILGPDSNVWYFCFYPTNVFYVTAPQPYWLMVYAQDTSANPQRFGWKSTASVSNDISVHTLWKGYPPTPTYDVQQGLNFTNKPSWLVTTDTNGVPLDLAFKLITDPSYPPPSCGAISISLLPPNDYVLTWSSGVLQSATAVNGPYYTLNYASPPWTNSFAPGNIFYRVQCY